MTGFPAAAYGEEPSEASAITPLSDSVFTPETDRDIRCDRCSKLLAEFATRPYQVRCPRCKTTKGALPRSLTSVNSAHS